MKTRILVGLVLAISIAVGIGYTQRASIAERLLAAGLPKQMSTNQVELLEDGLHVALCGAGGPMPSPRASGPCVVVVAGDQLFIVDAGANGPRNFARLGYPLGGIEAVFLTHFHSDHIDGLGELATLRWANGNDLTPLTVYGPEGAEGVIADF